MSNPIILIHPDDDLQSVFDAAPAGAELRFPAGIWRQKTVIRTPGLSLVGAGAGKTIFIYDDYAMKKDEQGEDYNTFRTWTMAVCAPGICMRSLSVVNDALHPETKGQEVALTVYGDNFTMEDCILRSTQDTLFLGPLPPDLIDRYEGFLPDELRQAQILHQQFNRCIIEGTVDFIFGCGEAVFDSCEIRSLCDVRGIGFLAAPAHSLCQKDGFFFRNCILTSEEGVTPGSIYLARPWRDYGMCRFENCTCGSHISPAGFDKWNDTARDQTARFYEFPPVPGRVTWINRI